MDLGVAGAVVGAIEAVVIWSLFRIGRTRRQP